MFSLEETRKAHEVVLAALRPTPAFSWPLLAARLGAEVVVKHENHQPTGAFKVRGGLTYVEALMRREPQAKGLVSATRGNHGQSLAFAGRRFGLSVTIVVPHGNSRGEERRDAGARRRAHRARRRTSRRRARRRCGSRTTRGPAHGPLVPSRPRARRLDLRARALERASRSRRALRSDRPGLGDLRLHRRPRRARPQDRDRRRPVDRGAGLRALLRGRPRRAHRHAPTPSPTAWRRASPTRRRSTSSPRARRASCSSATTRSPRRSAPTGRTRTISPRARARRRSQRR